MRILHLHAPASAGWSLRALLDDRLLCLGRGGSLSLFDLHAIAGDDVELTDDLARRALVARIDGAAEPALHHDLLVVGAADGTLRRHDREAGWRETATLTVPPDLLGERSHPPTLKLSPSGRFLYAKYAEGAHLVDLADQRVVCAIPCKMPAGHASFTRLPTGEEVLFVSAPSYMGIQMIACGSGHALHRFSPTSGFDFCHVAYELSADGSRLFAFGCVWAGPYAPRIYDASAWSPDAAEREPPPATPMEWMSSPSFPLRLLFELEWEAGGNGTVLPMRASPGRDGATTCVTLVDLGDVPTPGSEDDTDVRESHSGEHLAIYEALQAMRDSGPGAVVIRRVDPRTGHVVGHRIFPAPIVPERRVRILSDHRVLLLGREVEILDGLTGETALLCADGLPEDARGDVSISEDLRTLVMIQSADGDAAPT